VPARLVQAWRSGLFDIIVSPRLLAELERALGYRRVRAHVDADDARILIDRLARTADIAPDPDDPPPIQSGDPDDDYLIALAAAKDVFLVTGDRTLLALRDRAPVLTPAEFIQLLEGNPSA
jgi:predicted nucleic acid-binding protein